MCRITAPTRVNVRHPIVVRIVDPASADGGHQDTEHRHGRDLCVRAERPPDLTDPEMARLIGQEVGRVVLQAMGALLNGQTRAGDLQRRYAT